jgi:ubiquinone/menaquinone biosynthesis C-methylase UbiE
MNIGASQRHRLRWFVCLLFSVLLPGIVVAAEDRQEWQQPDRVIEDLGLKPGAQVADIGCGGGYFAFRLAQAVGEKGKVFAVDVDEKALNGVRERIERERLTNIEAVTSAPRDTKLKPDSVDAALLCLVLHEVAQGERLPLVEDVAKAIKPGGFLFIVDWRKSHDVKFDPYDKLIPRDDLVKLATDAGLVLDAEFHYLKLQVFLRFRKPISSIPTVQKPLVVDVWPGTAPGEKKDLGEDQTVPSPKEAKPVKRLTNVNGGWYMN